MKTKLFVAVLLAIVVGFGACNSKDKVTLSSEKVILSFTVDGENWCSGTCGSAITKILPKGTTSLRFTPVLDISPKAQYAPQGEQDFSSPVTYTITAEDASSTQVTVTVNVSANQ